MSQVSGGVAEFGLVDNLVDLAVNLRIGLGQGPGDWLGVVQGSEGHPKDPGLQLG